jgi:hypothetical protein
MIDLKLDDFYDVNQGFTFSRNSTAFNEGMLVLPNNARYVPAKAGMGNGVLIEEPTYNMLQTVGADPLFKTLNGWNFGYSGNATASIIQDSGSITNGYVLKYVDTDGSTSDTWDGVSTNDFGDFTGTDYVTFTIRYRVTGLTTGSVGIWSHWSGFNNTTNAKTNDVSGDANLEINPVNDTGWVTKTFTWQTPSSTTYPNTYWKKYMRLGMTKTNVGATLYVDYVQAEKKSYATSFTDTTRLGDTLGIQSSYISSTEGTIEFSFIPKQSMGTAPTSADSYVDFCWGVPDGTTVGTGFQLRRKHSATPFYQAEWYGTFGVAGISSTGVTLTANQQAKVSFRWKSGDIALFINGVKIGQSTSTTLFSQPVETVAYLGRRVNNNDYGNAIYYDVRISNIARTDTELQANGVLTTPLPIDANTTLKLDFNSPSGYRSSKSLKL